MIQNPRVGIGVLIINDHNQILLGERKGSHGEGMWAPPGGHLEFGETFEECALREAWEETNLQLQNPKVIGLTNDVFKETGKHYVTIHIKVAYPIGQKIENPEKEKSGNWQWFSADELPSNIFLPLKHLIIQQGAHHVFSTCGEVN